MAECGDLFIAVSPTQNQNPVKQLDFWAYLMLIMLKVCEPSMLASLLVAWQLQWLYYHESCQEIDCCIKPQKHELMPSGFDF